MRFTDWVQSHHRSILFLLAIFGLAGFASSLNLPVSLFPQVSFPRLVIGLDAGDRPAERMAIEVTWPVEQAVRAVPAVRNLRSTTSRGNAEISLNFEWGTDMVAATLQVESAINQVLGSLPSGTLFSVRRMDPTVFPVLGYSVTADGHDAVLFNVYQQPGGNTVRIAKDIKAKLADLKHRLPADVRIANWYDQSELIVSSAGSVRDAILIGVVFATLVLLLFLRNLKVTLIAAITVPMVLAATVLLLAVLKMSFNIMDDVRQRVEQRVPGLEIEMAQLMEDLIGDLTAVPQPIEIKLFSDDLSLLRTLAPRVARAIGQVPGVVDVKDGIVLAGDALDIRVDREKAALEGVAAEQITTMLDASLSGLVTTQVKQGPKMVGVRVWIPEPARDRVRTLKALRMRAPDGHVFSLRRVAQITNVVGQPEITRANLKQMVAVTGRITGRDLGSTVRDVKAILDRPGLLSDGTYYLFGGLYAQQRIAFRGLITVFVSAVVLVFVLLLFLYESFRVAMAMLLTTLLALGAVFIGLWLTHTELNITAMMGMTMIVGIVTEVAIFYYSECVELRNSVSSGGELLISAGKNRMRPIAMTTLAAILALLPLALGIGQGAAMQRPLAIAIISGLIAQLPLVLVCLPLMLAWFGYGTK